MSHPIENIMKTTMENIKDMIDVNTVVGDPVNTAAGATIIPLSKVAFGFVSGGGEYGEAAEVPQGMASVNSGASMEKNPFAGGSGAGVSVSPVAFLIVANDQIKMLTVDHDTTLDRVVELVPQIISDVQNIVAKSKEINSQDNIVMPS